MGDLTYRTIAEERRDKAQLEKLHGTLNAANNALRKDDCGLWVIRSGRGHGVDVVGSYISTWGDGETWQIILGRPSARSWSSAKKRLQAGGLCKVTQDGDEEGCLRLLRLPDATEAAEIRHLVGLRQTRDVPAERADAFRRA